MAVFTSILISLVAWLVGVKADVTFWKTSTYTETAWSTQIQAASTVWNTETYTETAWSTYIPPAVTLSIPYTVTSILEKDYTNILTSTVEKDFTATITETSVSVSVVASLATKYSEYTATLTSVVTSITTVTQPCTPVTIKQPTTITIPPTTVTAPPVITTPSLTGLVTCPSRTVNPTYTTSTPLPDDYTWGCPPGYLCKPPQINCNFEQNPPADTYYCAPDECVPAPLVPSFNQTAPGCGPYQTAPSYFNFNPELFGLSYSIFVDGGDYAETCSACTMTTWVPVTQISDGQPQAPTLVPVCQTSEAQPQAPAPTTSWVAVSTVWDGQPQEPTPTTSWVAVSTVWDGQSQEPTPTTSWVAVSTVWDGQSQEPTPATSWVAVSTIWDGQSHDPFTTTPPRLARRQITQPLPQVCYEDCNVCLEVAERDGKLKCCPADSSFSSAYGQCSRCLSAHRTDTRTAATALLPSLEPFISYCNANKNAGPPSTLLAESNTTPSPASTSSSLTTIKPPPTTTSSTAPTTVPSSTTTPSSTTVSRVTSSLSSPSSITTPTICGVSQISDGQPQACTNASTSAIATFTGAAHHLFTPPNLRWSSPISWALLLLVNALQL